MGRKPIASGVNHCHRHGIVFDYLSWMSKNKYTTSVAPVGSQVSRKGSRRYRPLAIGCHPVWA